MTQDAQSKQHSSPPNKGGQLLLRIWQGVIKKLGIERWWDKQCLALERFSQLFQAFIVRDLAKNRLRTTLTIMGIALGVAILLAINLANVTAVNHFKDSLDRISGKSNVIISASGSGNGSGWLKETILADLQRFRQSGVKFTPVIEQSAVFASTKEPFHVQVLGVDMLADSAFRNYDWKLKKRKKSRPDQFFEIFEKDGAFVGEALASRNHLKEGDTFSLLVYDQVKAFRVAGILAGSGVGGAYGGEFILMDIATAQETFNLFSDETTGIGRLSHVDVIVPNVDQSEDKLVNVMSQLEASLPPGVDVSRPEKRSSQVDKMLRAYQYNLTVLSFIALLVGMFLIYNTMSITIIRRRSDIGTLRALGVSVKQIVALFGIEALGLGIVGSLLGILLGLIFEIGAIQAVSKTIANLYVGIGVHGFSISPIELLKAFAFGLVITFFGSLIPILEASRVQPAEATRKSSYESKLQRASQTLSWFGIGLGIVAYIAALQPPINGLPIFGFLSALCIILCAALLTPAFLQWLFPTIEPLVQRFGSYEAKIAIKHLQGSLGRTSIAIASLMIGIAMMVSLAVMIGSFRDTVKTWVAQTLKADLWVEPASKSNGQLTTRISPEVVDTVRFTNGVEAVDAFYEFPIQFKNSQGEVVPARIGVGQWHIAKAYGGQLKFLDGRPTDVVLGQVLDHLMTDPSVLVTESFATRNNIKQGQMINLETPTGPMDVRVADIYTDYSSDLGYIVMPRELYSLYYEDDSVSGLAVYLEPNVTASFMQGVLQRKFGKDYKLTIRTNKELRQEVLNIFDNTFAITYALHVIAIIVALLGIMNSLLAMVLASKKEFAILKYLGSSKEQIRKIILTQAATFGLVGYISGVIVGIVLSLLLVFVINKQSFGWTIQWSLPIAFLIQSFALVMITSVLSGLIPAKSAAETLAPEALHAE